jgi:hypothetical protein
MNLLDDIGIYLPKSLSPESTKLLLRELKQFPGNIDKRLYTTKLKDDNIIYQGDGLSNMLVINLPETSIRRASAMVLSNTCDIDLINKRLFPSNIVYTTIFNLAKYRSTLIEEGIENKDSVEQHIESIRKQEITQIFYLPPFGALDHDSIVFFDRINNCDNSFILRDSLKNRRLFTLSQYGHYLFLFKLSVHYMRLTENVNRGYSIDTEELSD